MKKIKFNPQKAAWEAHIAARAQAAMEAQAEQAANERRPWYVITALISQGIVRLPFAVLFKHGDYVEKLWRSAGRVRRAWRILNSGRCASRITDARWEMCNRCPERHETEQSSFCGHCGCGEVLIRRSILLQLAARVPVLRAIPRWLIRVGRLEYQNTLVGWDCSLGFFREVDHG